MAQIHDILKMTAAEFEAYATASENRDRTLELIAGEVVEVVSGEKSASFAMRIGGELVIYLKQNPIGYLTGSQGGFEVGDDRYIPDVGLVLYTDSPEPRDGVYHQGLSLAIEVVSPTDRPKDIASKVLTYTQNGIRVWVVDPSEESVTIFAANERPITLRPGDVLTGDPLLPGLNLPVKDIFSWPKPPTT